MPNEEETFNGCYRGRLWLFNCIPERSASLWVRGGDEEDCGKTITERVEMASSQGVS